MSLNKTLWKLNHTLLEKMCIEHVRFNTESKHIIQKLVFKITLLFVWNLNNLIKLDVILYNSIIVY